MKVAIRYYTRSGHVKKLAEAIAEVAGVEAKTVGTPLEEKVDVLFLGSSVYGGGLAPQLKEFVGCLKKDQVGKIVNFSTAGFVQGTYKAIKDLAAKNGLELSADEFHCKGQFKFFHKGRPNETDVAAVKEFAKKVLAQ